VALSVRPSSKGRVGEGVSGLLQAMDHWNRARQDGQLTIRMEQVGDTLTVRAVGELGRSTAETFEAELRLAISGDASTVVLDLGDVRFIDSTGVRSVVRIANQSLRAGARLRMRRPSPSVQQALEGSGLEHLLPLVD
jgi:anti-anti-sigma factor